MVHLQAHENYRRHVRCVIRPGWYASLIWFVESLLGLADKNPMTEKYREHLKHYIPLLEKWGFGEAAVYFQRWSNGDLQDHPPLEISKRQ